MTVELSFVVDLHIYSGFGEESLGQDGVVSESGSHDELVSADGLVRALWRAWTSCRGQAFGTRRDRPGVDTTSLPRAASSRSSSSAV